MYVEILVDDLVVYKISYTDWFYQFNVTSFLDSKPRTVEIRAWFGNDKSYCDAEVMKIEGTRAKTTLLAKKTIRAADLDNLNRYYSILTIEIALPEKSTRPLWAEHIGVDLKPVLRDTYVELMKEIFTAMQQGDVESLMALIGPALINQAMMEGAPPDLLKQAMRSKLQRYCIPNIPVETQQNYHDCMPPLDFETMGYFRIKESNREDKKGNLYSPEEPIRFYTKKNQLFVARIFISCTHDESEKWFVSRFLFDQADW